MPFAAVAGDFFAGDGFFTLAVAGDFFVPFAAGDFFVRLVVGGDCLLDAKRLLVRAILNNCVNSDKNTCQTSNENC